MPTSRKSLTVSQLRVGIFVFVALLILGFLILNSTGNFNPFEKKTRLKARFTSADGLHKASDVQLAGVVAAFDSEGEEMLHRGRTESEAERPEVRPSDGIISCRSGSERSSVSRRV